MASASDFFRNFQPLFDDTAKPKAMVSESKTPPWLKAKKKDDTNTPRSGDREDDDDDTNADEEDDLKESSSPAALMRKYSDFIAEAEQVDEISDKLVNNLVQGRRRNNAVASNTASRANMAAAQANGTRAQGDADAASTAAAAGKEQAYNKMKGAIKQVDNRATRTGSTDWNHIATRGS